MALLGCSSVLVTQVKSGVVCCLTGAASGFNPRLLGFYSSPGENRMGARMDSSLESFSTTVGHTTISLRRRTIKLYGEDSCHWCIASLGVWKLSWVAGTRTQA